MEPMVVRRAGAADLIAYCWYELGYQPQESLILVAMHGRQQRLGMIARADLPDRDTRPAVLTELVRSVVRPLVTSGANSVMALICSDTALRPPEPRLIQVLLRELPRSGLSVPDVLGVAASAYRSLLCDDVTCCAPAGHPIEEVRSSPTAAAQILHGRILAAAEADLIADVGHRPDPELRDADLLDGAEFDLVDGEEIEGQRLRWWRWWRDHLDQADVAADVAADVVCESPASDDPRIKIFWWVLKDLMLRDAVLLHAMGAPDAECEALMREPHGEAAWARWGRLVLAVGQNPPSKTRVGHARELLARCVRHARPGSRAPLLAMLAWLAWFEGNGVRARLLVQEVFDEDPGYSLAQLVEEFLLAAVPPPWHRQHDRPLT